MNYIQPITRPINNYDLVEWRNEYLDSRIRFEEFVENIVAQGKTLDKAEEMWLHNFGVIPPAEPDRLYQCNIVAKDIKMTVTVLKRNDILAGQRRYDVVKLNNLYIDTYDYERILTVNEKNQIVFIIKHKDLSQIGSETAPGSSIEDLASLGQVPVEFVTDPTHALNYEDSNWFTSLDIKNILSKLKVRVIPYKNGDDVTRPKLYIQDMDFMETSEFEFTDKDFEQKLFDIINNKFIKIELDLK